MTSRERSWLVGALALHAVPGVARAWQHGDPSGATWTDGEVHIEWNDALTSDVARAAAVAAIEEGFFDWTRVECVDLSVAIEPTSALPGELGDGHSVLGWVEHDWPWDVSALAITQARIRGRAVVEADVAMNGESFAWRTSGAGADIATVVRHEAGHVFGLGHSEVGAAVMHYAYAPDVPLHDDDRAGICALYPGPGQDCTRIGCPTGYRCTESGCVLAMPLRGTCARCNRDADCLGGTCVLYGASERFCGASCADTPCDAAPPGLECRAVTGALPQCVRLVSGVPSCAGIACRFDSDCASVERCDAARGTCVTGGAVPDGEPCQDSEACAGGLCLAGLCSRTCDPLHFDSCGSGRHCAATALGTCELGACMRGAAGAAQEGDPCARDLDCADGRCTDGRCAVPCDGTSPACAGDHVCVPSGPPSCAVCRALGGLGAPCDDGDACVSGQCARFGESSFCTQACTTSCPPGFGCTRVDADHSFCVPRMGGFGAPCGEDGDCSSSVCGADMRCTRSCSTPRPCPLGYECERDGVCVVPPPRGGCRCQGPSAPASRLSWLLAVSAIASFFRRSRS